MSFTDASVQYTQLHEDVAGTVGCQELIALTCLHDVGLPRGEFNVALQDALRWQEGANKAQRTVDLAAILKGGSLETCSGSTKTPSVSAGDGQSASSLATNREFSTEESRDKDTGTGRKQDVVLLDAVLLDFAQQCKDALKGAGRLHEKLEKALESAPENLKGDLNQSISDMKRIKCHLDVALTAKNVIQAETPKFKEIMESQLAEKTKGADVKSPEGWSGEPLITLDAVRVAHRALEAGDRRQKDTASSVLTETMRRGGRTTRIYTKLKCYKCGKVGHKWWQKPQCRKKHDKRKEEADNDNKSATPQVKGRVNTESGLTSTTSILLWDDMTRTTLTDASTSISLHPIVDGGAKRSVIGLLQYIKMCDDLCISPKVHLKLAVDPEFHLFGTDTDSSKRQRIAGRVKIPIPYGRGRVIPATFLVVDGNVPPLHGKDFLREWNAEEEHAKDRLKLEWKGEKVSLRTYLDESGHARLPLSLEALQANIADSMLFTCLSEAKTNVPREQSIELLKRIHVRTHAH